MTTLTGSTATKSLNVNVTGLDELIPAAQSNGNTNSDRADWADARVTC